MSFAKCAIYLTNIYVVRKEESLPMRERGLKHSLDLHNNKCLCVAPHVGAWIETTKSLLSHSSALSLPMRERGLKPASSSPRYV